MKHSQDELKEDREFEEFLLENKKDRVPGMDPSLFLYFDNIRNDNRQLPKMPKEYICKLIFDRRHEAIVIRKRGHKLIGGIAFRVYDEQKFAEIAFLAISAEEQIRGFGTKLMNQLKMEMIRRGVRFLMTYADNLAIGYFKKQGFQKDPTIPDEIWKGYLKDYDGSTHMECLINPAVDYHKIYDQIKSQKDNLLEIILQDHRKQNDTIYTLGDQNEHRQYVNSDSEILSRIRGLKGISESTWSEEEYKQLKDKPRGTSLKASCLKIIDQLTKHKSAWPFKHPVKKEEVPDYYEIIKEPMDLETLQNHLNSGKYKTKEAFDHDLNLIFKNAKSYNQQTTIFYKNAVLMETFAETLMKNLKYDFDEENDDQTAMAQDTVEKKIKTKQSLGYNTPPDDPPHLILFEDTTSEKVSP